MASKPETNFRKRVRADLEKLCNVDRPVFFEAIQQKAIKGSPDFVLCVNGYFVALELKAVKGKVSRLQEEKLKAIAEANGIVLVADPKNWPDVLKCIQHLSEEK